MVNRGFLRQNQRLSQQEEEEDQELENWLKKKIIIREPIQNIQHLNNLSSQNAEQSSSYHFISLLSFLAKLLKKAVHTHYFQCLPSPFS